MEAKLSDEFLQDYRKFAQEFDEIVADLFQGARLDSLAKQFLAKHESYITNGAFPFQGNEQRKFPNCSLVETLDEDLRIVIGRNDDNEDAKEEHIEAHAVVLADVYRRACQACYLRVTFNKCRLGLEEDRREAVDLGRRAIRYNSTSFLVTYWYMIALGWQLDVMSNPKERTLVARIFRETALRCIRLDPSDPLAHNLLGRYYYSVAGLTWLERTVAKSLLGCKLEGSYQDSEREFRRAHELRGDWLPSGLWLARALIAQKRPIEEIKHWIDFGLQMDCKEPSSEIERGELLELQAKLKLQSN